MPADAFAVDTSGPVADIVDISPDPRTTSVGVVAIDFSEDVTGVDVADFTLSRDGNNINLSAVPVSGGGQSYSIDLANVANTDGAYTLTLVASGSGIVDAQGNTFVSDAIETFTIDTIAPTADINDVAPDPATSALSSFEISFNEPVTNVDIADFSLTVDSVGVDISGLVVSQASPSQYLIDASTLAQPDGNYQLTLNATGSGIADLAGNLLLVDGNDTWQLDSVPPTVTLGDVSPDPRNVAVGILTVDFSEPVNGVDIGDFVLTGNGSVVDLSGVPLSVISATEYSLDLTTVTGSSGSYVLTIGPGTSDVVDPAGNGIAPGASESFVVDVTAPTAVIEDVLPNPTSTAVGLVTINFDEPVTGVDATDFTLLADGSSVDLTTLVVTPLSGQQFTADLSSFTNAEGSYTLTLTATGSGIVDTLGNPMLADASVSYVVDFRPTANIVDVSPDPHPGNVGLVSVNFADDVVGFDIGDVGLTRDGATVDLSAVSVGAVSASSYTLDLSSVTQQPGAYMLTLVAAGSGIQNFNGDVMLDDATEAFVVNPDVPTAGDDVYVTEQDEPLTTALGVDDLVLNDSDPNGSALAVTTVPAVDTAHGTLSLNSNGTFTYQPNPGFFGTDEFTYEIVDAQGFSNFGNVTLKVFEQAITPTAPIHCSTER